MNKLMTVLAMLLLSISSVVFAQQDGLFMRGKIIFGDTQQAASKIDFQVNGTIYQTDEKGIFQIAKQNLGEKPEIVIERDRYQIVKRTLVDQIVITLVPIAEDAGTIMLSMMELDSEEGDTQSTPGLLFATNDAFSSIAGYGWGPYWFRQRGYQSNYSNVYFDGINMANPEKGYASWSVFGGLNDVTKNKEASYNFAPQDFTYGNIGGSTNIITKPSQQRTGFKASYSLTNSNYNNRLMLTYSSGLTDKGWAFTASASRRWAQEGYVDGSSYDAYGLYASVEKRFSSKHSMYLTAFIAPTQKGMQSPLVQEIYDLKENNLFNTYWGYQEEEKRNSRMKTSMLPQFILNDEWHINDEMTLKTAVGYSFGKEANTALNWYDAADPRPDYYRNLPSYQYGQGNTAAGDMLTTLWTTTDYGQLNWDALYHVNRNSLEENPDGDGSITGNRAHYVIEKRQNDIQNFEFNPTLLWNPNDDWKISTGIQYDYYIGNNYNTLEDLLGADYYVDIDNFADRDFPDPDKASNDLLATSNIKKEGDRIGHDYKTFISKLGYRAMATREFTKGKAYAGANVQYTSMYRDGQRMKGLFPENSYGKSEVLNFLDYSVKAGGEYFLNGRNVFTANASYSTQAPWLQDAFVSIRTRNETVKDLESAKILSGDVNYHYRGKDLKVRASAYFTQINDLTDVISYFDDSYTSFVNYSLTGIGQRNMGIEIGAEYQITEELKAKAATSLGKYTYTSNALATTTVDNSAEKLADEIVYFTGMHVGGTPETAGSIGLEYWSKRYWFVGITANYLANRYVTLNPSRYTERALAGLEVSEDYAQMAAILEQENMEATFTLDLSAGKSWRWNGYFINFNVNVTNLLNNEGIKTTGFQQYRFDFEDQNPEKYANKYFYAQGMRVFANLGISF